MPAILPAIAQAQEVVFTIVGFVMRLAPLAVFGATAHLVGEYGIGALSTYGKLIAVCYAVASSSSSCSASHSRRSPG